MCNKLVSIIMCCYNEEIEWVKQSIESLLSQQYENLEIIIVNDNPNNHKIIRLLEYYNKIDYRIKLIFNNENLGLVRSLNKALLECNGYYIARMDSDDISRIDRIKLQVEYMEENTEVGLVMSYANLINENGEKIGILKNIPLRFEVIKQVLKYKNISIHPTWMFRKEILLKLKKYNECMYVEDYDFLCRAITSGIIIKVLPKVLLDYRIRKTSVCNSNRLVQQIYFQKISKEYIKALKGKSFSFEGKLEKISDKKINFLNFTQQNIYIGRELINKKKIFKRICYYIY